MDGVPRTARVELGSEGTGLGHKLMVTEFKPKNSAQTGENEHSQAESYTASRLETEERIIIQQNKNVLF